MGTWATHLDVNYTWSLMYIMTGNDPRSKELNQYVWQNFNHYHQLFSSYVSSVESGTYVESAEWGAKAHILFQLYMHLFVARYVQIGAPVFLFSDFQKIYDLLIEYQQDITPAQKQLTKASIMLHLQELQEKILNLRYDPTPINENMYPGIGRVITQS